MIVLFCLSLMFSASAEPWIETRDAILEVIARVKQNEPVDHLYAELEPARLENTLWRWAMTDEMPCLRARATQLLGETTYSSARFLRLINEMERSILAHDARAYDLMVAVAHMRAGSPEAAAQMRERVRRGVPDGLRAHYYRARVEYELVPPGRAVDVIAAEMAGPSRLARDLAFRDALRRAADSDLGLPSVLIVSIDFYLLMAPERTLLSALAALRQRPAGLDGLIPSVLKSRVHHPSSAIRRAAARTLFGLRGGLPFERRIIGGHLARLRHNLGPLNDAAHDLFELACERMLYRR